MKKLLLVMLVPVLVLGVMGCGKVQDGAPSPIGLQDVWQSFDEDAGDMGLLTISGNQATLFRASDGNIAFRTSYDGYKGPADSGVFDATDCVGKTFKLEFYWFEKPYDQIGYINAEIKSVDRFVVKEVKYNNYYQNVMLPLKDAQYDRLVKAP
jgi:hypothetical protein